MLVICKGEERLQYSARLRASGSRASFGSFEGLLGEVPNELTDDRDEVYEESESASRPAYRKQARETLKLKTVGFDLAVVRIAGSSHQPFIMDPLEISVFREP